MVYFILAFLIVLADQASKYIITLQFAGGGQFDLLPGILRITYITNTGGAFSMFSEHTMALAIVSAVVCVIIIVLMITLRKARLAKLALGFILGGAIGNLIDRFVMGYVVDMFEPLFVDFAVFNVADIFITVGAFLFVIAVLFCWPDKKKIAKEEEGEPLGPRPVTYEKPKNAQDRRAQRRAKKYGPDIDETTIIIPVDEVRAAVLAAEAGESYEPSDFDDTRIVEKITLDEVLEVEEVLPEEDSMEVSPEEPAETAESVEEPAAEPSAKREYTLEEIMKEYGSDY